MRLTIWIGAVVLAAFAGLGFTQPNGLQRLAQRGTADAIAVDVELVLAVDVSYSMDPEEQALQREGYITGFTSRDFMQALRGGMHGIAVEPPWHAPGTADFEREVRAHIGDTIEVMALLRREARLEIVGHDFNR